jgi:hypothetical protein
MSASTSWGRNTDIAYTYTKTDEMDFIPTKRLESIASSIAVMMDHIEIRSLLLIDMLVATSDGKRQQTILWIALQLWILCRKSLLRGRKFLCVT